MEKQQLIDVGRIQAGEHEQRVGVDDEAFNELVKSIGRVGLINPLVVCPDGDNYVLIAGHRRLDAVRRLGLDKVRCMVRESSRPVDAEITFAENFCRKDLTPVEQACAIKDVIDSEVMTIQQVAAAFHRSEHWVAAQVAMCGWPADVLEVIHGEILSVSAASNLAMVDDDTYREFLLRNAVDGGATARTTSAWLQAYRSSKPPEAAVEAQPVTSGPAVTPAVPQAPCLCCSHVYRTDELSHVPICPPCIKAIRSGMSS